MMKIKTQVFILTMCSMTFLGCGNEANTEVSNTVTQAESTNLAEYTVVKPNSLRLSPHSINQVNRLLSKSSVSLSDTELPVRPTPIHPVEPTPPSDNFSLKYSYFMVNAFPIKDVGRFDLVWTSENTGSETLTPVIGNYVDDSTEAPTYVFAENFESTKTGKSDVAEPANLILTFTGDNQTKEIKYTFAARFIDISGETRTSAEAKNILGTFSFFSKIPSTEVFPSGSSCMSPIKVIASDESFLTDEILDNETLSSWSTDTKRSISLNGATVQSDQTFNVGANNQVLARRIIDSNGQSYSALQYNSKTYSADYYQQGDNVVQSVTVCAGYNDTAADFMESKIKAYYP